jgi:hypothetical protein
MNQLNGWIRHINDLRNEDWFNRPWLLLGTGHSLDNFNPKDWKDHNIAAIYDAYYACDYVDVLLVSDYWHDKTGYEEWYFKNKNIRYVATRSYNIVYIGINSNVVMWEYDCDKKNYNVNIFHDVEAYPCSNTSSFAVMWLGKMGVKEIKTFGIDSGKGMSKYVTETYKNGTGIDHDFTHENEGVYGHAQNYGIQLIKQ